MLFKDVKLETSLVSIQVFHIHILCVLDYSVIVFGEGVGIDVIFVLADFKAWVVHCVCDQGGSTKIVCYTRWNSIWYTVLAYLFEAPHQKCIVLFDQGYLFVTRIGIRYDLYI